MTPDLSDLYSAFDSDPAPVVAFLQRLARMYGLSEPLRTLDVGCGPGRLLGPLQKLGWEVTGMEPNAEFLATARRAARASRRVRVLRGGFLDIEFDGDFDLVLGANMSFAHLLSPSERKRAVQRIFDALRSGGVICLDLPNLLWILKNDLPPQPHASVVQGQEVTLHRRHEIDFHRATFTTTDEYIVAGGRSPGAGFVHAYGIVGFPEVDFHLTEAGFEDVRTFAGYDARSPERLDGPRMLVAARKPAA